MSQDPMDVDGGRSIKQVDAEISAINAQIDELMLRRQVLIEEKESLQTSFMDLPDDIHLRYMKYLDLPSRLKLRVNKRLDELQMNVKNVLEELRVVMPSWKEPTMSYRIEIKASNRHYTFDSDNFDQLERGLRRMARNTHANTLRFNGSGKPTELVARIVDALFCFSANDLTIFTSLMYSPDNLQVNLSNRLLFAQNARKIDLDLYTSLTAQDLSTIHKIMMEGGCSLEDFCVKTDRDLEKSFIKQCFGVSIAVVNGGFNKIFLTTDDSIELCKMEYLYNTSILHHFKEGVQTTIDRTSITFKKSDVDPRLDPHYQKIPMNEPFSFDW